jgi:hydrogenase maturation protein HypF
MAVAPQPPLQRRRLLVTGVVQGVGFRPFVHRLATRHGLAGSVLNDGRGVVIEAEGHGDALDRFAAALTAEAPGLARVEDVAEAMVEPRGERGLLTPARRSLTMENLPKHGHDHGCRLAGPAKTRHGTEKGDCGMSGVRRVAEMYRSKS